MEGKDNNIKKEEEEMQKAEGTQRKKEEKEDQKKEPSPQEKMDEMVGTLQRVQAEFENYRKRVEKEKEDLRKYACADVIKNLLPIIDNFELAIKHAEHESGSKDILEGIKLIFSQIATLLEGLEVKRIEALGKAFDPKLHEALMADYSDKEKNTIIEEFQAGYIIDERVLRHSKVKISKGPREEDEEEGEREQDKGREEENKAE